jgi:uncharacterized protein
MARATAAALADARALLEGGVDALLVENWGDAPFAAGRVEPGTVAAMAAIVSEIRRTWSEAPLGINVLKNDGRAALAVACAVGARFIRVNVHAGAVLADQGIVQSDAYHVLRDRRLLAADVAIFADVGGKHAVPLAPLETEQLARDLVHRALADVLVVSGPATGQPTSLADVKRVHGAVPGTPLVVGSGVTPDTVGECLSIADAAIVGTWLKRDGDVNQLVDPDRVRRLVGAARQR